jgi:putative phage-type endonuclease
MKKYINKNTFELIDEAIRLMLEFIKDNILQIIHIDLYEPCFEEIYNILHIQFIENGLLEKLYNLPNQETSEKLLFNCVQISLSIVFKFVVPKRAYNKSYIRKNSINNYCNLDVNKEKIKLKIENLLSIKQPEQRTDEWYIFRNSTLTASNIYKVFISEYTQTQLILEKCEPLNINKFKVTNLNSPLHWGQKYEPVSILYYEYINKTKVTEFGCIPHPNYSFVAASPDGIVCDNTSHLYGRMLEIKNVVSREITGIPKMEYWIQMQLQMEVCDLNECDFLETKFTEYQLEEDYVNDVDIEYKGIILQYLKNNEPYYIYAPFMLNDINSDEYKAWFDNETNNSSIDMEFIRTIYWKIEKISCILVLRNKFWFSQVLPSIELFWNNLVEERETGKYKDRIKKKRRLELEDNRVRNGFPGNGCLIGAELFTSNNVISNVVATSPKSECSKSPRNSVNSEIADISNILDNTKNLEITIDTEIYK